MSINSSAVEFSTGQWILRHDGERNREPPGASVERPAALSVRQVAEHGALVRRLRKIFEIAATAEAAECDDLAGPGDGVYRRRFFGAAEGLQVPIEHLRRGRNAFCLRDDVVQFGVRLRVELIESWRQQRRQTKAMTGPARH